LFCIDVDEPSQAPYPGWVVDSWTSFSEDCSLGIDEVNLESSVIIYPNPVSNIVYIENKSFNKITSLNIYNLLGKLVLSTTENFHQLDVSSLKSGLYFLKVQTEKGEVTKKLIKS
jgi:hypothetical protein